MHTNSAVITNEYLDMDAGIKTILAIMLAAATTLCSSGLDLFYFALYLTAITFLLGSDLRFILKNLASYGLIFIFPYLCGLLFAMLMNQLFAGPSYNVHFETTGLRMVKIFFIWYIGSLYFFTTPIQHIMDMLGKVLAPLNALGVPVDRHLNMATVTVKELTRSVSGFKQEVVEKARLVFKNQFSFKTKLQELSGILAAFIADSLQKTGDIQQRMEMAGTNYNHYSLRIARNEVLALLSFVILILLFLL